MRKFKGVVVYMYGVAKARVVEGEPRSCFPSRFPDSRAPKVVGETADVSEARARHLGAARSPMSP